MASFPALPDAAWIRDALSRAHAIDGAISVMRHSSGLEVLYGAHEARGWCESLIRDLELFLKPRGIE